jgi:hypothetical protein
MGGVVPARFGVAQSRSGSVDLSGGPFFRIFGQSQDDFKCF